MKKLSINEVVEALQESMSLEHEYGKNYYYLHITEDGEIVSEIQKADISFRAEVDIPDELSENWHDHENESNQIFMEAIKELTDQANDWLE